ncbi:MAG: Na+/H+ antiporter NhaA, partial [Chitinophagaceae bacterium]|nr:Na+/H+ antiporter NhaA [Chitinophagaceae bacterium]
MDLLAFVNDGLMSIFFLLIGLEIKREIIHGELSTIKKASLPVIAAFGGAIVPAIIYFVINRNIAVVQGWGIPMATDIAFALAIISLLRSRVPNSLKVFLAALAIVDDLIAILVIAIFYSDGLHYDYLFYALAVFGLLVAFNRLKIRLLPFYIIPGLFIWYFIHHSGIHATIAGVITAIAIPGDKLEHYLLKPVNYLIVPVFAIVNIANINFSELSFEMLESGLSAGILAGLLIGKPVGIFLSSWLTVKLKLGHMPSGANWKHMAGLGILGGIGFTMSIFIAILSFDNDTLHTEAKFAILIASATAAVIG